MNTEENIQLITLERQEDGNWIGKANKFGTIITVREVGPESALQALLTHNGNQTH